MTKMKRLFLLPLLSLSLLLGVVPVHADFDHYTPDANETAEFLKYGIDAAKLPAEDPNVDLKTLGITSSDRANIGFTMYLDPESDLFDTSDTSVIFTHEKSGVSFSYTFSHLTDYDMGNHIVKGIIQIPADSYFDDYSITVYTVSNGFNGGNLCYQEEVKPVAGETYGLYAAAGSTDWLQDEGAKLLSDQKQSGSELKTDTDTKADKFNAEEEAKQPKGVKEKEDKPKETVTAETKKSGLTTKQIGVISAVLAGVVILMIVLKKL